MRTRVIMLLFGLLLITGIAGTFTGLPAAAQLPPPTATPPDQRLVETFISSDGTLAFNYPAGWIAEDNGGFFTLASSTAARDAEFYRDITPGELYLSIEFFPRSDYAEDSTPRDWLIEFYRIEPFEAADGTPVITLPNNLILRDDPILLAEDRFAAVGDRAFSPAQPGGSASETITIVFELGDRVVIIVAGCQRGQLQPLEPLIYRIAASLQTVQQDVSTTRYFVSTFEDGDSTNALWVQGSTTGGQAAILAGFYNLVNTTPGGVTLAFPQQDEQYEAVSVFIQGFLDPAASSATSSFGVVFGYQNEDNYVRFAIDGVGRFSLAQRETGEWTELVPWTADAGIFPLGLSNSIELTFDGIFVDISVNQRSVVSGIEVDTDEVVVGAVGLYLASGDTGSAGVLIDQVRVTP